MGNQGKFSEGEVLDQLEEYLKRIEVRYGRTVLGEYEVIGAPWVIEKKDFLVLMRMKDEWIWSSAAVLLKEEVPRENAREFLFDCLKANHLLPEICFDADQDGNLGTSQEIHVSAIMDEGGFSEFKYEFFAIPACIKYFLKNIAPKYNVMVNGFTDMVNKFIEKVQG
ncbi:hypothetical protein GF325_13885 [Candidatus Bathyarchaeota archaeon]|nr:hypothetical protein [Candidatus Bathyarchaeota archaeon]